MFSPAHRRAALCALLVVFSALVPACKKNAATPTAPENILRISQRNEPADLDPATATLPDEFFILRALSEGLVTPTPSSSQPSTLNPQLVSPAAATHWDVSADGLTYTFHLRRDALWSNGEPVTAADFVDSYRRVLTPATAAPKAHVFFPVKNARAFATGALTDFTAVGIHAADAHTLVFTLEHPTPAFLAYVASGPWLPVNPRTVARHGRTWTRPENFVGNGPFLLADWRPHQRLIVKRNPRHHAASAIPADSPDEIHFLVFDNDDTEERAYRTGQLDVTLTLPRTKIAHYTRERPGEIRRLPLAETRYLAFNTTRRPLDDARVRRALSLAIDREQLTSRVLLGTQEPASRLLPPALAPAADHATSTGSHQPDLARQLLAEAGYANGKNFPPLELTAWSPSQLSVLEAIQAMWRQTLQIEIRLSTREAKVHLAALAAGDYDIAFMTLIPDVADPAAVLAELTSASPINYPHWSDPSYDARLAELQHTRGPAARAAQLLAAERQLLDAAPLAPLYFNVKNFLISPRVHGWREDPLWQRDYSALELKSPAP